MTWSGTVVFEVSSADPDSANPVWVDLTAFVRPTASPVSISTGRQNDLDASEPSQLTLQLDNRTGAFTYGNTASPYATWWGPGRKCRLRESVGGFDRTLFTGYLQMPTETLVMIDTIQRVQISAVDRLARLGAGEPFISTLAAHIQGSARIGTLVGYWPLNGTSRNFVGFPATATVLTRRTGPLITPANVDGPPGDDQSYVAFDSSLDPSPSFAFLTGSYTGATVTSGDAIALVAWVRMSSDTTGTLTVTITDGLVAEVILSVTPTQITGRGRSAAVGDAVYSGGLGSAVWQLCTLRFSLPSGAVSLWIGSTIVATAVAAGPITPASFGNVSVAATSTAGAFSSLAHLQVYVGTEANCFGYADHLAQLDVGLLGLERQSTGARIRTIAGYAGIPAAEYVGTVDVGQSVMQPASLAGKTAVEAMRDAERTEQGLLYVDGNGSLGFKDRRTLYNV